MEYQYFSLKLELIYNLLQLSTLKDNSFNIYKRFIPTWLIQVILQNFYWFYAQILARLLLTISLKKMEDRITMPII